MNKYILISILIAIGFTCPKKILDCPDLKTSQACNSTASNVGKCQWDNYSQVCYKQYLSCPYYIKQKDCEIRTDCSWIDDQCQEKIIQKTFNNCTSYSTYESCIYKYNDDLCTWEHNKCVPVTKCSEVNDYIQCRNMRLKERCQIVINGKSSQMQKQFSYLTDIFDDFQCRPQDCVYKYSSSDCPNFKNGRRCFQYFGGCTQCSYFTKENECTQTNQCTWDGGCRNILCSDLKSKSLCSSRPYCIFNDKSLTCETRTENNLYCYYYDIGSEPKKSTHRDL